MKKQAVILFTRAPIAGQTKTRLMPFLTGEECAGLHKRFILDMYETCSDYTDADILVFYTPEDCQNILRDMLEDNLMFLPQYGEDLGERMANAFGVAFRLGYEKVVLVGTDIPQITKEILEEAFEALEEYDIAINPTVDGGYYLIGMGEEHEAVWNIEQYGTNMVVYNTLEQLKHAGLRTKVGKVCRDIDTKEDLAALYAELQGLSSAYAAHTGEYLRGELRDKMEHAEKRGKNYGRYECG